MSKLKIYSNGSHILLTKSGHKNIHKEVYEYIRKLEVFTEEQKEIIKKLWNKTPFKTQ